MTQSNILWVVSQLSVWLQTEVGISEGDLIVWYCKNSCEIRFDTEEGYIDICNSNLDNKTYFAIGGLCKSLDLFLTDSYTEDPKKKKI